VSSFAFQGTNANVVISMAEDPKDISKELKASKEVFFYSILPLVGPFTTSFQLNERSIYIDVNLGIPKLSFLKEHVIQGMPILPAAAFLEIACESFALAGTNDSQEIISTELVFKSALVLNADSQVASFNIDPMSGEFIVKTKQNDHFVGSSSFVEPMAKSQETHEFHRHKVFKPCNVVEMYELLSNLGLQYENSFKLLRDLWLRDSTYAEGRIESENRENDFFVHPAILDGALHVVAGRDLLAKLETGENPSSEIPVSIDLYSCSSRRLDCNVYATASLRSVGAQTTNDIQICSSSVSNATARIDSIYGYEIKAKTQKASIACGQSNYLYSVSWLCKQHSHLAMGTTNTSIAFLPKQSEKISLFHSLQKDCQDVSAVYRSFGLLQSLKMTPAIDSYQLTLQSAFDKDEIATDYSLSKCLQHSFWGGLKSFTQEANYLCKILHVSANVPGTENCKSSGGFSKFGQGTLSLDGSIEFGAQLVHFPEASKINPMEVTKLSNCSQAKRILCELSLARL
jgi:hypothetical protein